MSGDNSTDTSHFPSLQCMNVWGGNEPTRSAFAVTGIDATARCRPWHGQDEGGDLYLASQCACATISRFILADVAGHGMRVAPLARRLRKLMYKHINRPDQTDAARALSSEFAALEAAAPFATALLLTYLPQTDHLVICNAGHPPPLWYRQKERRWHVIDADDPAASEVADPNFPIGVLPGTTYQQCAVRLEPGDVIVLYTDGLTEAAPDGEQMIGVAGLRELLMRMSPEPTTLADRLLEAVGPPRDTYADDDQTVLVLHHHAADPPRQSMREKLSVLARLIGVKASLLRGQVPEAVDPAHPVADRPSAVHSASRVVTG